MVNDEGVERQFLAFQLEPELLLNHTLQEVGKLVTAARKIL